MVLEAELLTCRGMLYTLLAFQLIGYFEVAPYTLGSEALVFEHRFHEYWALPQPEQLPLSTCALDPNVVCFETPSHALFCCCVVVVTDRMQAMFAELRKLGFLRLLTRASEFWRAAKQLVDAALKHTYQPLPPHVATAVKALGKVGTPHRVSFFRSDECA